MRTAPTFTYTPQPQSTHSESTFSSLIVLSAAVAAVAGTLLFWHLAVGTTTVFTAGLFFKGLSVILLSGIGGGLQISVILSETLNDESHPAFHMFTIAGAISGFLLSGWAGAILGWLITPTVCALSVMCCCRCHTEEA